jgi:hypothetical protein
MGAGASAGSADLKSKVFLSEAGDNFFIPLKNLASHLKVYQHCTTGEVLVLVDHNIGEIGSIVDHPNDWFPVSVSKKESKYLETLKVLTSLNEREGQSSEGNGRLSSRTAESGHVSLKRHDSDRSLLDNLRVVGPESDKPRKMSDDPARKGKLLPPINIPPSLFGQTMPLTPHRLIGESNLGSKRLLVLGARSDDNSPPSPRTQVVDATVAISGRRDNDSDFGGSPGQTKESPLASKSSRKPRSVKALRLSDDSAVTTEHKGSDAANQLDVEVQIDSDMIESAAADCCQDSSAVLARLVRENLVYNPESRTHCCLICGDVADDSYPIEQVSLDRMMKKLD